MTRPVCFDIALAARVREQTGRQQSGPGVIPEEFVGTDAQRAAPPPRLRAEVSLDGWRGVCLCLGCQRQ
ncbi:hypothetical protein SAMN05446589_7368 [Streptomyces sp. OV198]|jgi:hypothetical protein|nr:hypothetical protein SAMN05446589_7368 [Streptomyces sp. OV198]